MSATAIPAGGLKAGPPTQAAAKKRKFESGEMPQRKRRKRFVRMAEVNLHARDLSLTAPTIKNMLLRNVENPRCGVAKTADYIARCLIERNSIIGRTAVDEVLQEIQGCRDVPAISEAYGYCFDFLILRLELLGSSDVVAIREIMREIQIPRLGSAVDKYIRRVLRKGGRDALCKGEVRRMVLAGYLMQMGALAGSICRAIQYELPLEVMRDMRDIIERGHLYIGDREVIKIEKIGGPEEGWNAMNWVWEKTLSQCQPVVDNKLSKAVLNRITFSLVAKVLEMYKRYIPLTEFSYGNLWGQVVKKQVAERVKIHLDREPPIRFIESTGEEVCIQNFHELVTVIARKLVGDYYQGGHNLPNFLQARFRLEMEGGDAGAPLIKRLINELKSIMITSSILQKYLGAENGQFYLSESISLVPRPELREFAGRRSFHAVSAFTIICSYVVKEVLTKNRILHFCSGASTYRVDLSDTITERVWKYMPEMDKGLVQILEFVHSFHLKGISLKGDQAMPLAKLEKAGGAKMYLCLCYYYSKDLWALAEGEYKESGIFEIQRILSDEELQSYEGKLFVSMDKVAIKEERERRRMRG